MFFRSDVPPRPRPSGQSHRWFLGQLLGTRSKAVLGQKTGGMIYVYWFWLTAWPNEGMGCGMKTEEVRRGQWVDGLGSHDARTHTRTHTMRQRRGEVRAKTLWLLSGSTPGTHEHEMAAEKGGHHVWIRGTESLTHLLCGALCGLPIYSEVSRRIMRLGGGDTVIKGSEIPPNGSYYCTLGDGSSCGASLCSALCTVYDTRYSTYTHQEGKCRQCKVKGHAWN